MSHIFIELYFDEDVDTLIATLIRTRGFSATTAREEGQLRRTDREQVAFATQHGKAIVTHNRNHFLALSNEYYASGRDHCGIIIARRRSLYDIVNALVTILDHVTAEEFQNQLRYI